MAGQSSQLSLEEARKYSKGAGHTMGSAEKGTKASVPEEGHTLGSSKKGKGKRVANL